MKQLRKEMEALRDVVNKFGARVEVFQKSVDDFNVIAQKFTAALQLLVEKGVITNEEILDKFNTNAEAISEAALQSQRTGDDEGGDTDERSGLLGQESESSADGREEG